MRDNELSKVLSTKFLVIRLSDEREPAFAVPNNFTIALEQTNTVQWCLGGLQEVEYRRLDYSEEAILMMHRVKLILILGLLREVRNLIDNLISCFELIDTRDKLILGHWIVVSVEVELAANNEVQCVPPKILDDQILADG